MTSTHLGVELLPLDQGVSDRRTPLLGLRRILSTMKLVLDHASPQLAVLRLGALVLLATHAGPLGAGEPRRVGHRVLIEGGEIRHRSLRGLSTLQERLTTRPDHRADVEVVGLVAATLVVVAPPTEELPVPGEASRLSTPVPLDVRDAGPGRWDPLLSPEVCDGIPNLWTKSCRLMDGETTRRREVLLKLLRADPSGLPSARLRHGVTCLQSTSYYLEHVIAIRVVYYVNGRVRGPHRDLPDRAALKIFLDEQAEVMEHAGFTAVREEEFVNFYPPEDSLSDGSFMTWTVVDEDV